jgi:hypothetical protein
MGKQFDECVAKGGYIKTIQKGKGKYQRTCSIAGRVYNGKIKKKKN